MLQSSARGLVECTALLGALSGLVYNTIIMVGYRTDPTLAIVLVSPAFYAFYGIYVSFAFVPGLIGFARVSKGSRNIMTKLVLYFGFFWTFFTIVIGQALTIFAAVKFSNNNDNLGTSEDRNSNFINYVNLLLILYYSNWGFVATYLILLSAYVKNLKGRSRYTMVVYSLLNIMAVLVFTIVSNTGGKGDRESIRSFLKTYFTVMLVFCDILVAIAFMVAAYFGDTWKLNSLYSGDRLESFVTEEDSNRAEVEG